MDATPPRVYRGRMTRYARTIITLALCYLGVALLNSGHGHAHAFITIVGVIALCIALLLVLSGLPARPRPPRRGSIAAASASSPPLTSAPGTSKPSALTHS